LSTRRDFLRAAGLVGTHLCLGAGGLGCACDVETPARVPGCAAATFEVTPTGALLSVQADAPEAAVRVAGREIPVDLRAASGGGLHTGAVELDGLTPDRDHEYSVVVDGGEMGPYRLRTAPPPDSDTGFRFLFTGDIDSDQGCAIFETMARSGADFWLSMGDFPYARRAHTREEYTAFHRAARLGPGAQTLLAALPAFAIYDDHEVRDNWDADTDPERVATALAVWDEWFPLRTGGEPRYRSWRWGRLAEFFMLDCRRFRAASAAPDVEGKSMLGEAQREWLIEGLRSSTAVFKLVATTVPLAFGTSERDSWLGYTWERDQILRAVIETPVPDTIFLAADQHWFASHHLAGGVVEIQAGPATATPHQPGPAQPEEVFRHVGPNFAELTVEGGREPRLTVRAVGPYGEHIHREVLPASGR
jgi:phosphodiesterase/alkaline phosphatase D-like protein